MLFTPSDTRRILWDSWLYNDNGTYHLFHLTKYSGRRSDAINHAVSSDLLNWKDLGPVIRMGTGRQWDAGFLLTGTVIRFRDSYYMFYGARRGHLQLLGLAVSSDLNRWEKFSEEPLLAPDPRWYETDVGGTPLHHAAWRDPCIQRDSQGIFHLFLCARVREGGLNGGGAIAHAVSDNLLDWEIGPPVHVSGNYGFLEVPDVFFFHDRWYLLFSCGEWHSCRSREWPRGASGIRYLVSEGIDGPYIEPENSLLLGSPSGSLHNYAGRSIACPSNASEGRIFYYNNVFPNTLKNRGSFRGSWAMPKKMIFRNEKPELVLPEALSSLFLKDLYSMDLNSRNFTCHPQSDRNSRNWKHPDTETVEGSADRGFSVYLDLCDYDRLYISSQPEGACRSCGFLVHYSTEDNEGTAVMMDYEKSLLRICGCSIGEIGWIFVPITEVPLPPGMKKTPATEDCLITLVLMGFFLDVYCNGTLTDSLHMPVNHGKWGFFAESGSVSFRKVRINGSRSSAP